jgi:hypothetical protein
MINEQWHKHSRRRRYAASIALGADGDYCCHHHALTERGASGATLPPSQSPESTVTAMRRSAITYTESLRNLVVVCILRHSIACSTYICIHKKEKSNSSETALPEKPRRSPRADHPPGAYRYAGSMGLRRSSGFVSPSSLASGKSSLYESVT